MQDEIIYHHGIKGQKWGIRRYQNEDGSLTPAGKKRVSKEYKKVSDKVVKELNRTATKRYVDSYNKAADYMNSEGIRKFNTAQEKKYGKDYGERDGYIEDYEKFFSDKLAEYFDRSLNDFYSTNKNYAKSKELVDKYSMTDWDQFARENEAAVDSVRKSVEEMDKKG